jgi:hypothetical protein
MSISLKTSGAWIENTAAAPTVTLVGSPVIGDRYYIWASWKTYTITASMPAGWTEVTEFADGTTASGNGTGSMKVACWYRDWMPSDSNPALTFSTATGLLSQYVCQLWQKGAGETWDAPLYVTQTWPSASTATRSASTNTAVANGSVVMCLMGFADDSALMTRAATTAISASPALTWNDNYVESPATHASTTTGNDMSCDLGHRFVTTGHAATALSANTTLTAAETGAILWVVQGVTTLPAISTLTADFDAGISAPWATTGGNPALVTSVGGAVQIAHTAAIQSNFLYVAGNTYSLIGDAAYLEVTDYGNQSLASHYFQFLMTNASEHQILFNAREGSLQAFTWNGTTSTQVGSNLTLDTTAHRWLRLRESGGTTYFDTAPDGATWTNRWSVANAISLTSVYPSIKCACEANEATGSQAVIDNFNVAPPTTPTGTAAGSYTFAGSATGKRVPKGSAAGAYTFAGTAAGKRVPKGTVSGAYTFTGTAAGKRVPKASAAGAYTDAGAATGTRTPKSTATGTYTWAGATAGTTQRSATSTGTYIFTGSATGEKTQQGSAAGSYAWSGAATGTAPAIGAAEGSGAGTYTWAGSAAGTTLHEGTASGSYTVMGQAAGTAVRRGSTAATYVFAGEATGTALRRGSTTGTYSFIGAAAGEKTQQGTAVGGYMFTGTTVGARTPTAVASGAYTWTGSAAGIAPAVGVNDGSATGSYNFTGIVTGERISSATASGNYTFAGQASGAAPAVDVQIGSAAGSYNFAGSASGATQPRGAAAGGHGWDGAALGWRISRSTAAGAYLFTGTTTGTAPTLVIPEGNASGSYGWTGAALSAGARIGAAAGSYGWAGRAWGFLTWFDPDLMLIVAVEDRTLTVVAENPTLLVAAEDRTLLVTAEDHTLLVMAEDRTIVVTAEDLAI